tara:strand:+ start:301 stop:1185 length:885 start_codon:yes stop_codon:yes gene_type:complete
MASSRDNRYNRELGEKVAKRIDFSKPARRVERDRDDGLPKALLARMQKQGFDPSTTDASGDVVNPYGSSGLRQYISFPNLEQNQINEIYNKRVQRFLAPETMAARNPQAMRRGFGSLFGSSEGEATISGPLRKQVPDMTTTDLIARGIAGLATPFGPVLSMTDPRGTTVVPEGSPNYDPSMDPRNKDTSMLGNMLNFFTGGAGTQGAAKLAEVLPNLPTVSELLPGNLSQQPINEIDEGSVANPFYPDMQRQESLTPEMLPRGDREAAIEAYKQGDQLSPDLGEHIQLYYETRS